MTTTKLRNLVTEAVSIDREIADLTDRLKSLKSDLIAESRTRTEEHTNTIGGGVSWLAEGNDGCIARVTFPGARLKSSISGEGSSIEKIRNLSGTFFSLLFRQSPSYKPVERFREEAIQLMGKNGKKLIKAMESQSSPSVSFETKEVIK